MADSLYPNSQGGTSDADIISAVRVSEDGGVFLVGYSTGSWGALNVGEEDFIVVSSPTFRKVAFAFQRNFSSPATAAAR